jgi:phage FluMu protein Com
MPIEFRCTQCDRLLRTPDGTAGKSAKCPQCGTVVPIPETAPPAQAPPPQQFDPPPEPAVAPGLRDTITHTDAANPYQSPAAAEMRGNIPRGYAPTQIDLGETLSRTWELYKQNMGMLIAGTLIYFLCNMVVSAIVGGAFAIIMVNARGVETVVVQLVQQLFTQAVATFFWIGMIRFMLQIARGEPAEFGTLFSGGPWYLYGVALQIITTLAVGFGFLLLIVPGIILALMFSQAMFMLVDQDSDIMGSLRLSIEATKGNKLTLLGLYIVAGAIALVITVLTCGLGALLAMPFMMLLSAVIYLGVTGQSTVLDGPAEPAVERHFGAPGAEPAV